MMFHPDPPGEDEAPPPLPAGSSDSTRPVRADLHIYGVTQPIPCVWPLPHRQQLLVVAAGSSSLAAGLVGTGVASVIGWLVLAVTVTWVFCCLKVCGTEYRARVRLGVDSCSARAEDEKAGRAHRTCLHCAPERHILDP